MSVESKKDVWYAIKIVTFMICLAGFVANTFMIFKQFIGKQTITSHDLQHNKELAFPSFTICSHNVYKEKVTKTQDLALNYYLNNTVEIEEILISVSTGDTDWTIEQLIKDKTFWDVTTTYSIYKGRCHTIRYKKKVLYTKHLHFHNLYRTIFVGLNRIQ